MRPLISNFCLIFCLIFTSNLDATPEEFYHVSPAIAKVKATNLNQNIFVYYSADWCLPCQKMEEFLFVEKGVLKKLDQNFVLISAEYDEEMDREWFDTYNVSCMPTLSIINKEGVELARIEGYVSPEELDLFIAPYISGEKIIIAKVEMTNSTENEAVVSNLIIERQEASELLASKAEKKDLKESRAIESKPIRTKVFKAKNDNNPPTLISIKKGVKKESSTFYKVKDVPVIKEKVPPAVDLKELAAAPSRGAKVDKNPVIPVSNKKRSAKVVNKTTPVTRRTVMSAATNTNTKKTDTPLRTPITGKLIKSTRSNVGIQFGAFGNYDNAVRLIDKLGKNNIETIILEEARGDKVLFKVMKMGAQSMFAAKKEVQSLNAQGIKCFLKLL